MQQLITASDVKDDFESLGEIEDPMQSAKGKDVRTLTFEPLEFYQTEQMHELISDNAKTKYFEGVSNIDFDKNQQTLDKKSNFLSTKEVTL